MAFSKTCDIHEKLNVIKKNFKKFDIKTYNVFQQNIRHRLSVSLCFVGDIQNLNIEYQSLAESYSKFHFIKFILWFNVEYFAERQSQFECRMSRPTTFEKSFLAKVECRMLNVLLKDIQNLKMRIMMKVLTHYYYDSTMISPSFHIPE